MNFASITFILFAILGYTSADHSVDQRTLVEVGNKNESGEGIVHLEGESLEEPEMKDIMQESPKQRYMRGTGGTDVFRDEDATTNKERDLQTYYVTKGTGAYVSAKGTYVAAKGTYVAAKGTYVAAKGTYVAAKGTYVAAKGTYVVPAKGAYVEDNGKGTIVRTHTNYHYFYKGKGNDYYDYGKGKGKGKGKGYYGYGPSKGGRRYYGNYYNHYYGS